MDDEITEHELQNQEIWTRVYFNGYFYKFIDMCLCVDIRVDPEQNDDGQIQISNTFVFPPIDEKDGHIDISGLLEAYIEKIKQFPGRKVRCVVTGFGRQFKFNPKLLSVPIPEEILKMFQPQKKRDDHD